MFTKKEEVKLTNPLLLSVLASTFFYSYGFIVLNKAIMESSQLKTLSLSRLVGLFLIIVGNHYFIKKFNKYAMFRTMLVLEVILYGIVFFLTIWLNSTTIFLFADAIIVNTITNGINVGIVNLKNDVFSGEARLQYDMYIKEYNVKAQFLAIALLFLIQLPNEISFIIAYIGIIIDNLFVLYTYNKYVDKGDDV